jgi:hypothetical protein
MVPVHCPGAARRATLLVGAGPVVVSPAPIGLQVLRISGLQSDAVTPESGGVSHSQLSPESVRRRRALVLSPVYASLRRARRLGRRPSPARSVLLALVIAVLVAVSGAGDVLMRDRARLTGDKRELTIQLVRICSPAGCWEAPSAVPGRSTAITFLLSRTAPVM